MRVGIALGSNLGDRAAHLRAAVAAIREFAEPPVLVSRVYETEPVDCPPNSPIFLNAAIEIEYSGDLHTLLKRLQIIEQAAGRPIFRSANAPRPIDLDILYADDLAYDSPDLKLPHPRLMNRLFVLTPLADIVPNRKLPGNQITFSDALQTFECSDIKISQYVIHN